MRASLAIDEDADRNNTMQMSVFRRVRKTGKKYFYFFMSVRPSAWNNSAPIKRTFMKFDISVFLEKSRKFRSHQNMQRITGILLEDQYTVMIYVV